MNQGKLKKLKEQYTSRDDRRIISEWEKRFKKMIQKEDYAKMDQTKELIRKCDEETKTVNMLLAYDENVTESDRKALFRQREVWEKIKSLFDPQKVESVKQSMENWLDEKIQ